MLHSQIYGNGEGDYDRWLDLPVLKQVLRFSRHPLFIRQQAKLSI